MAAARTATLEIQLIADVMRLQADMKSAQRAIDSMSSGATTSFSRAGAAATEMASSVQKMAAASTGSAARIGATGEAAKVARHHMVNLTAQANDLAVQLAAAAQSGEPLKMVFMALFQQGSQIVPILGQINHEAKQTGSSLGAMVTAGIGRIAPYALAAGAAIGALGLVMQVFTDEVDKSAKHNVTWGDVALGTFDAVSDYLGKKLGPAFKSVAEIAGVAWEWIATATKKSVNIMIGATSVIPQVIGATLDKIPQAFGDAFYSAANLAIKAINWLIQKTAGGVNSLVDTFNSVFGTKIAHIVTGSFDEIANPYKGGMSALGSAGAKAFTGAFERDYLGEFAKFVSPFADKRAGQRLSKDAKDAGGKAGAEAGKAAGEEFGKNFIADLANSLAGYEKLLGDQIKAQLGAQNAIDAADFSQRVTAGSQDFVDRLNEAARPAAELRAQLNGAADILERMDGLAGKIGGAMRGIATGDWSGVSGNAGALIQIISNTQWRNKDGEWEKVGDKIFDIFKEGGPFARTLVGVFQGAGIGSQVAGIIGNGSTGANLGGMAGGALGNHLGGQISAFGGVLGSIAGSVLGTVLGGLFKKTPTGSVMISNGSTVGTSGNGGRASEASSFGGAVLDSLNKIASALGVSNTGSIKLSVGMRGENYVVDPLGLGRTKESDVLNFGKDSAAALEAAVRLAIEKGALEGLTEGTKKFLLEGDLQTQINRYNDYKSALTEYSQIKDPQRFETQALENQRGEIIQTAQQLGASLDDMAKLEELFQIKRNEIIEKYTTEAAEIEQEAYRTRRALEIQIMELEGNATGALAAARELEKSQVDASLIPLYDRIYALQDEKAVTDAATQAAQEAAAAAKAIADERYGLETRILELQGNTAALRERELAAIDPANRALKEYIYTLEDSAAAAANAAAILSQQGQIAITRSGGGGGGGAAANGYVSDSELDAAIAGAALGIDKATGALGPFLSRIIVRESSSTRRAITDAQRIAYVAGFDPSLQADASNAFDRQLQRGYYDEAAAADRGSAGGGGIANGNGPGDPAVLAKWLQDIWKYAALGAAGQTGISDAANDNLGRSVKEVTDRFRSLSEELTKFRDSLFATEFAPERSFGALRAQYNKTAMLAQTGDETALAGLPQIARQYLDIAKTRASSRADYEAIVSGVIDNVNGGIGAATAVVDRNQAMLDAQTRTADGIDALRQEVKGLREDNKNLQKTVAAGNADQRKTANALNDASRGGVLKVELAA